MSVVTANSTVTASTKNNYALLTNLNDRPLPNALKPHKQGGGTPSSVALGGPLAAVNGRRNSSSRNQISQQESASNIMRKRRGGSVSTGNAALPKMTMTDGTAATTSRQGFFPGQPMAANTPLGRLPTLGLNQIKLEDFIGSDGQDDNNMFRLHKKTEHMLVARELEREFKDLNKFDKSSLRVWEKPTATRIDRPGTIRVVNEIPALKPLEFEKAQKRKLWQNRGRTIGGRDSDDQGSTTVGAGPKTSRNGTNSRVVNIFDNNFDDKSVKANALRTVTGDDERALMVSSDDDEDGGSSNFTSTTYSQGGPLVGAGRRGGKKQRGNSIEYLNRAGGGNGSETVRDFIVNSRKILMAQIQINQKTEETELLKEYIVMEKDKLDEGRKTFQEDQEKYTKFKMDL